MLSGSYAFREEREPLTNSAFRVCIDRASSPLPPPRSTSRPPSPPPAVNRARPLMNLFDKKPSLGKDAFVAPNAAVIGAVSLGDRSSVFYGCVLRGDAAPITVGEATNIQDGTVVRTGPSNLGEHASPTNIGSRVTVGHMARLHGCTIEDEALIGMGATLLPGSTVKKGAMVAAGAVVAPGTTVPSGQIWGGNPAALLRALKPEEAAFLAESAQHYVTVAAEHLQENSLSLEDVAKAKGLA
jgi:gamma-carbonic anhydrase